MHQALQQGTIAFKQDDLGTRTVCSKSVANSYALDTHGGAKPMRIVDSSYSDRTGKLGRILLLSGGNHSTKNRIFAVAKELPPRLPTTTTTTTTTTSPHAAIVFILGKHSFLASTLALLAHHLFPLLISPWTLCAFCPTCQGHWESAKIDNTPPARSTTVLNPWISSTRKKSLSEIWILGI